MNRTPAICSIVALCCALFAVSHVEAQPGGNVLGRCCFLGIVPEPTLCEVTTEEECFYFAAPISWTANLTCDTPCPSPCEPFDDCGTLIQAVECVLFQADGGGLYLLENTGGFQVGDRVRVRGCVVENCATFCMQGNGCINANTIGPCDTAPNGACCVPMSVPGSAFCVDWSREQCEAVGGDYHGDNTSCETLGACPPLGRCCFMGIAFPPYLCDVTTEEDCENYIGSFWNEGLTCDVPCGDEPTGACCLTNAPGTTNCFVTTPEQCAAHGGAYQGHGTTCGPTGYCEPPITGACCFESAIPEGICLQLTAAACEAQGGAYQGDGSQCPPNGPQCFLLRIGACCLDIDDGPLAYDTCIVTTLLECMEQGGQFRGPNTQCQQTGCCLPGGYCQDADPGCCIASGGQPVNAPCGSFTACPGTPTGACCIAPNVPGTSNCIVTTAAQCEAIGGDYRGNGTNCNTVDRCPPLGRCCFLGIVPTPVLCDVTTRQDCESFAGFISWTAHLTCDAPCEPSGDVFTGCGTLGPGPQGCVLFHADSGETFALQNVGPVLAPRVFVRGEIEPNSFLCFPIIMPGLLNNTISLCFDDCGVLVQGVECVLFQSDGGGLYVLQNTGGFSVGDRVRVTGGLNPICATICQQGDGCIEDNTIELCDSAPPIGACCSPMISNILGCIVTTAENCAALQGEYQGDGTNCHASSLCPPRQGRCCFYGINPDVPICEMMSRAQCISLPAPISWDMDLTCDTPCMTDPPRGACCGVQAAGAVGCVEVTSEQCESLGGAYQGDGTICYPVNACPGTLGRCCFLGFNPDFPLCEVTTLAQCYQYPAPLTWTPGIGCDEPCDAPCLPGDANGDGVVDSRDLPGFVRSILGDPADGDHPECCNLNAVTLSDEVAAFVQLLMDG